MKRCLSARWIVAILAGFGLLTGCGSPHMSALDPKGPVGETQLDLINLSTGIMTLVVIVVAAIYIYVVIKYRERPGDDKDEIPEQVAGSKKLEILWTTVPIILLIILAVPTISTTFRGTDREPEPGTLRINATGYQYWFGFEYPDYQVSTANEVHIPTGRKVEFLLAAHDVVHSFWVPSLGGKQDMNPGRTERLILQADEPGLYEGECAELCGASHATMRFRVIAHPPAEFEKWIASRKQPKSKPKTEQQKQGHKLIAQNCIGCHAIQGAGYDILGRTGPELTGFSHRTRVAGALDNNRENLKKWLVNPQKIKPGNRMPGFDHLDDKQLDAMVEYLQTLK